jgi:hypothetical protein
VTPHSGFSTVGTVLPLWLKGILVVSVSRAR